MTRFESLLTIRSKLREILGRYDRQVRYTDSELKNAKAELSRLTDKIKEVQAERSEQKNTQALNAIEFNLVRLGMQKSRWEEIAKIPYKAEDSERLNSLIEEFNTLGAKFRFKLVRGAEMQDLFLAVNRLFELELKGHVGTFTDSEIPYLKKVLEGSIGGTKFWEAVEEAVKANSALEVLKIPPTYMRDNLSEAYGVYNTVEDRYFFLAYPELFEQDSEETKEAGVDDKAAGVYLGLALGAFLADKKYDSIYIALGQLSLYKNSKKYNKEETLKMYKRAQKVDGLLPTNLFLLLDKEAGGKEIKKDESAKKKAEEREDTDEDLLLAISLLPYSQDSIPSKLRTFNRMLLSTLKGNGFSFSEEELESFAPFEVKSLQVVKEVMEKARGAYYFEPEVLSCLDSSMLSNDSRRGAIVGAVLGAEYGSKKLREYYSSEIKEMSYIFEKTAKEFNIMNLNSLLQGYKP